MADLADIAAQYNLTLHAYADDNQLYIHFKPENVESAVGGNAHAISEAEKLFFYAFTADAVEK